MKIYNSICETIGKTPIVRLNNIEKSLGLSAKILAKLELFNPAGSAKDRVALGMICDAEEKGILKEGSVIIEPTSGNTGIGLALVGAAKGYRVILTMPDTMSVERRQLLSAYGATLVLTEGKKGMQGAIDKAHELAGEYENSFIPSQFTNQSNPKTHFNTTGPEIWDDCDGKIDIFVAGIGTGGTLSGVGEYLKSKNPDIKIIGVEPTDSPLITKGVSGPHTLQGIGANFVPDVLNQNIYDEIITVSGDDAYNSANMVARNEGFLVGITSGAALHAVITLAKRVENKDKTIVVFMPDTGEHYLSTGVFDK